MRGVILLLPQYVFMAWCLVKYRDKFTFTLIFTAIDTRENDMLMHLAQDNDLWRAVVNTVMNLRFP